MIDFWKKLRKSIKHCKFIFTTWRNNNFQKLFCVNDNPASEIPSECSKVTQGLLPNCPTTPASSQQLNTYPIANFENSLSL